MAKTLVTVLAVTLLVASQVVSGKRGCSAFGHSCFGGHGKRSGDTASLDAQSPEALSYSRQIGQEETPPHPGYPHSGALASGDDIIPVRDGGAYDRAEDNGVMREFMKFRLRNIVKQWMDNYRRQKSGDDIFLTETM